MIEPLPYHESTTPVVGWFSAECTLDGWVGARWSGRMKERLESEDLIEFAKLVNEMLKLFPEYLTLIKYFHKHGNEIRCEGIDPTFAFIVERPRLNYVVETTGPNFWIEAHRKGE